MRRIERIGWVLVLVATILGASVPRSGGAQTAPTPAETLVSHLLEALNSKDATKMQAFARDECGPSLAPEQRAARMASLADQGAPFTLVRITATTEESIKGLVSDRNGRSIGFILNLLGSAAAPKMASLRVGDPESLDAPPPKDYTGWQDLGSLAAAIRTDTGSPAIGIAMMREGKTEVVTDGVRALGAPEKVGADEPWSIGSIGKPICSTIIGKLIEAGKLRFETTLQEALPGVPMQPGYQGVTLEQIMHHRGGIPEDPGMRKPQVDAILAGETDPVKMRDLYARDILSRDPIAKPGERFAYSNAGYALLSHIAERTTGKPYEQLVRDMVFVPLGLEHSYIGAATYPKDLPAGHIQGPDGLRPANFRGPLEVMFAGAGGGMYMSVGDLAKFGAAHLAGLQGKDGYLRAATVERLHRGVAEGEPGRGYACGWSLQAMPGVEPWHGHNGSNGTFRAELAIFPRANLVAVAIVNRGGEGEPAPGLQAVQAIAKRYAKAD